MNGELKQMAIRKTGINSNRRIQNSAAELQFRSFQHETLPDCPQVENDASDLIEAFRLHLMRARSSQSTIRHYVCDAQQFADWLMARGSSFASMRSVGAQPYLTYLATALHELRPGKTGLYASRTVKRKVASLRAFFRMLIEDWKFTIALSPTIRWIT
jgi:hypothetical protein